MVMQGVVVRKLVSIYAIFPRRGFRHQGGVYFMLKKEQMHQLQPRLSVGPMSAVGRAVGRSEVKKFPGDNLKRV